MKPILNSILASTLLLSTLGTSFAQENSQTTTFAPETPEVFQEIQQETLSSGKCGNNATYSYNSSTGTLTISGTGAIYDYDYNTMPWYSYHNNIKTLVIAEGITAIGEDAFSFCASLTSVSIPSSVTTIGDYAFSSCSSLTSVSIPSSVTSIGEGAFSSCSSLTSVSIPSSVTSIGDSAFWGCTSLATVSIPNSVNSIGERAFAWCSSLAQISVADNNPKYSSVNGVLFNKNKTELIQYPIGNPAKTYEIPSSVTTIGDSAFSSCSSLTSVSIPSSVTTIGDSAFSSCSSLTSVSIPNSVTTIGDYAFFECTSLTSASIPNSVTSIGKIAFGYCDSLTSVSIPNSVTTIGYGAFADCQLLSSINVSESNPNYCSVDGVLFDKNKTIVHSYPAGKSQKFYEIPSSVTAIVDFSFYKCNNLTSVSIPNSVTTIGDGVFEACISLTSVSIGNSVTSIGNYAFSNCTSLNSVSIPNSVTSIGNSAFWGCTSLASVFIPDSVQEIGSGAFHYSDNTTKALPKVTLYGYAGSYAQTWCNGDNPTTVPFVAVGSLPDWAQGSTTPTPSTFSVSSISVSNGTVKLNQTTAEEGERVTLSVTPNSGYMIDSVLVKDSSGNSITCGYDWVDGVYTFLMPSGNVSVTANFSKIPETTYTPTITTTGQGNSSLSVAKPSAGDKVQVTVSPSSGYVISSVTVKDSSGNDILCVKVTDGVYQYSQPSGNVTIHVNYYFAQTVVESYSDINYADWYAAYASYAIENGLMNGTSVGYFDPYIPVSRGMVAVILASASGESIPYANGNQFTDVEAGLWYSNAIEWCKSKNIVAGYEDGRFGVNDAITREQMVTILRGFANYMGYDSNIYFPERLSAYTDSTQVAVYAREPFSWALGLNYIQGTGNEIKPQDNATRAEFANLLNYFMESN